MPQRTKKEHNCSHHTERGSRWHNFHFSGKVIVCSVILGFMLILVGGILMAIGMDSDDDTKSDKYDDLQKKPPMVFVGPAIMGIGGFAVIVGVLMCLIETNVCRKRNPDSSPLINGDVEQTEVKEVAVNDCEATAIPSTSRHHRDKHRNGTRKKSPSPRKSKGSKKSHSSKEKYQSASSSSTSDASGSKSSKYLTTSDTFLTPPNTFTDVDPALQKQHDKENQTTTSLMQSFLSSGKSWNTSTEFQTPSASFEDSLPLQFTDRKEQMSPKENHKFVTPLNSDAGILSTPLVRKETEIQEGGSHSKGDQDSSQNIQDVIISSEVGKTEDGYSPGSQGKPEEPKASFPGESYNSEERIPMGEDDNHRDNQELGIDKTVSSCEGIESGTSCEMNQNQLKDNSDEIDELVNENTVENTSDSIKDISTNNNVDYTETSSSNTASDISEENIEDAAQLNSTDIESINAQHVTSETTSTSSSVDELVETIDASTCEELK